MWNPFHKDRDYGVGRDVEYTATFINDSTNNKFTFTFRTRHGIQAALVQAKDILPHKMECTNLEPDDYRFYHLEAGR